MEAEFQSSLKGQFLIAMPKLLDPNFHKTVICMTDATPESAMGIVINRAYPSLTVVDILKELKVDISPDLPPIPIHVGGPVHMNRLFIIHTTPYDREGSFEVTSSLALSHTREIIEDIAMNKGPNSFFISLGCAGWGPGQLESEILQNAWLTRDIDEQIIFNTPLESRWEASVRTMGIDPASLSNTAGHA